MSEIIVVENLSYTYMPKTPQEVVAIYDVNLSVTKGEIVGIIGHTGCGKSTLIQHFNGLLKPTKGRVLIEGADTADKSTKIKNLCSKVGLVFQYPEYQLFEETVFKDVVFGPMKLGMDRGEAARNVKDALELMGFDFDKIKNRSPFSLSGGEMRRVAIAGVLAMNPSVLVLDEPTAGLDANSKATFLSKLKLLNSQGVTIIIVSHSMDEIVEMSDKLIVMKSGTVVASGAVKDIFSNTEVVREAALVLPQCTRLLLSLKDQGIDIDTNLYQIEETVEAVESVLRRNKIKI